VTPLTPQQVAALREIVELWAETPFVLIGASALGCWVDMHWRQTHDLDLSVACDMAAFPAGLDKLAGWKRASGREHSWTSAAGVRFDVLPAGRALLRQGYVEWPAGGRMSLVGFRLAFEHAEPVNVSRGLTIPVAPLHVLLLLKMVSFLDRPVARERDLADLALVLKEGVPIEDRFTEETIARNIDVWVAGAFLLGRRLAGIINASERRSAIEFLRKLRDPRDTDRARLRSLRASRLAEDELDALWDGFAVGLGSP